MSARDDLMRALWDNYRQAEKNQFIDAYRDEVALEIGRDALRDGLVPTLTRLVGGANAAKLTAGLRDAVAHELAGKIRTEGAYWGQSSAAGKVYRAAAKLIDPVKDAT